MTDRSRDRASTPDRSSIHPSVPNPYPTHTLHTPQQGFPIEERDSSLRTPIHAAVKSGHVNVRARARVCVHVGLADCGLGGHTRTHAHVSPVSPITYPSTQPNNQIQTAIIPPQKNGCDNIYLKRHATPQVVRLLLERGCDVDRMDDGQRTPLIYAAAAHNVAVMR